METIDLKPVPVKAQIKIPPPSRSPKVIARLESADLGYGERVILREVDFLLQKGDHFAVVGLNGAGKSTFLKVLAGAMPPLRGAFSRGEQVEIGYYAQHVAENLDPNLSVIENMTAKAHREVLRQETLNMAGSLLFSGDDIHKKVGVLSGGEKSRVALGQILLQKASCLILDEPTNHLDFQTVEALTQALVAYEGTIVVVSHDRDFVRRIGTKILEINHGRARAYPGTYNEYVWSLEKGGFATPQNYEESSTPNLSSASVETAPSGNYKDAKKQLDKTLRQCERKLAELEKSLQKWQSQLHELNQKIASGSGPQLAQMVNELSGVQLKIDAAEEEWLANSEAREKAERELAKLVGKS